MRHFPAFTNLPGQPLLVPGCGDVAERKAGLLRRAGAVIRTRFVFDTTSLDGCALAIAAGPQPDQW
jgi:hypothetical protein